MAGLIFEYFEEDSATSPPKYTLLKELPEIREVTSCKVEIQFNKKVEPHADPPEIIPLGVQGKIASLGGSFGMMNEVNMVDILSDDAIRPGYVLVLKADPNKTCWLLNGGKWKIDNFNFDREGLKQGKLNFTANLIYLWSEGESMYRIVGEGTPVPP